MSENTAIKSNNISVYIWNIIYKNNIQNYVYTKMHILNKLYKKQQSKH